MQHRIVTYMDLGRIAYQDAWNKQTDLFNVIIEQKLRNRSMPHEPTPNFLLFCEHNPVYTLGKTGKMHHLLLNEVAMQDQGIEFFHINRGGDITFHGPGQLTGYPIFDLDNFKTDIHYFMRTMEEAMIAVLKRLNIHGSRIDGLTGVWIDANIPSMARKICAMGVHTSRWVTMHGFGLNVNTDLSYFNKIVPCGIMDKGVTSIEKELGHAVDMNQIKLWVKEEFAKAFEFDWA